MIHRTMGAQTFQREPRIIAQTKDGKDIVIDIFTIPVASFRVYLERILEQDLTDDSRANIIEALKTTI